MLTRIFRVSHSEELSPARASPSSPSQKKKKEKSNAHLARALFFETRDERKKRKADAVVDVLDNCRGVVVVVVLWR